VFFLPVTQPAVWNETQSTDYNQWKPTNDPYPFFLHHWTPQGRGAAPFTMLVSSPKSTCNDSQTLGHGLSVNPAKSKLHKNTYIRLIFDDCYKFLLVYTSFVSFHLVCMFLFLYFCLSFMCLHPYHASDNWLLYTQ